VKSIRTSSPTILSFARARWPRGAHLRASIIRMSSG
jgi:hypothetical protein